MTAMIRNMREKGTLGLLYGAAAGARPGGFRKALVVIIVTFVGLVFVFAKFTKGSAWLEQWF
jgi:hypothetical protein